MAQGYFAAQKDNVVVMPVASAAGRDQLKHSVHAGAMVNDLVSTMAIH